MTVPKRYFHDKLILLLLSISSFLTVLNVVLTLLRLDADRGEAYIIQYRANLGLDAYKIGDITDIISLMAFSVVVAVLHALLSMRVYTHRRQLAVAILGLGVLLLLLSTVVSNALLVLR